MGFYTINEQNIVVRDLVQIIYFEDEYAFVRGTIKDGDLIVLGVQQNYSWKDYQLNMKFISIFLIDQEYYF